MIAMRAQKHKEAGFSLVELAIALTVIGLLIAGVLKGREMVDNARASRLIADVKHYDAAIMAFKNIYDALPGDMRDVTRIPGCPTGSVCATRSANGDSVIGDMYGVSLPSVPARNYDTADTTHNSESRGVWIELAKAGLINTIDDTYTNTMIGTPKWDYPETPWTGIVYDVYYWYDADPHILTPGHYIKTKTVPIDAVNAPSLRASTVAQIDRKMDDGFPLTGRVVGWNSMPNPAVCYHATLSRNQYSQSETARCEVSIRLDF